MTTSARNDVMLKAHELIGFMSPDLGGEILNFAYESDKPLYRTTLAAVAEARKLRPIFLERQARSDRHSTMLTTLSRPNMETTAATLIRAWLVKKQKPMLVAFLDGLGLAHNEGVVDDLPPAMDDAKLRAAVDGLLAKYPAEEVTVYLHAFNGMNEANWPNLKSLLETDPRLQFSPH
jgi:hypothetical protein